MDSAFTTEKAARRSGPQTNTILGKHPLEAESSADGAKRARLDVQPGAAQGKGVEVDVGQLPIESVIQAVMEGLEVVSLELLLKAFDNARRALIEETDDAQPLLASALGVFGEVKDEDEEILNPLDMDLEDEDDLLVCPFAHLSLITPLTHLRSYIHSHGE